MTKVVSIEDKVLARLPAGQMADRLMAVEPSKRLDLLLERQDAEQVVAALPEQDYYLFVKELGGESALSLLGLASFDQLNHIIDLECWDRDQVQPGKVLTWLEAILTANERKFVTWLYKVDFELLVLLFKQWLEVSLAPDDMDPVEIQGGPARDTIDDQYYFTARYPQYKNLLKSILSFLFEHHNGFYLELMNHVLGALDSEVEESAYQFHKGRLEDNAIPEFYEAGVIYHPLRKPRTGKARVPAEDLAAPPSFALIRAAGHDLLVEALARLSDPNAVKTLKLEMAALANKVVMADSLSPDLAENLKLAADKAAAYVNLGLDEVSGGQVDVAADVLQDSFLEDLFRLAHARISATTARISRLLERGWLASWPHGINCLDGIWQEGASLLLARTPMLLTQSDNPKAAPSEEMIRSRVDLSRVEEMAAMIESLAPLFDSVSGPDWQEVGLTLWSKGQMNALSNVTLGALLATAAARTLWQGEWQAAPLPLAEWPDIAGHLHAESLEKEILAKVWEVVADEGERELVEKYLRPFLSHCREELAGVEKGGLEAKLVSFLLFAAP